MKNTLIDAILSIKPIYAEAIISGRKKVEFRKKVFKKDVERIFIYSSSPTKMIIGYFTFTTIIEDSPEKLWEKYHNVGGISKDDFFNYYENVEKGFCIIIDIVVKFRTRIDPINLIENFTAPQSYIYLENKKMRQLT
jgi:predicted transcriptional regulator